METFASACHGILVHEIIFEFFEYFWPPCHLHNATSKDHCFLNIHLLSPQMSATFCLRVCSRLAGIIFQTRTRTLGFSYI